MYKNYYFYHYFPKIWKKSTSRPKKSTKKYIKKQLVKKKHKKAHVLFKSTLYEHCELLVTQQYSCTLVHAFKVDPLLEPDVSDGHIT